MYSTGGIPSSCAQQTRPTPPKAFADMHLRASTVRNASAYAQALASRLRLRSQRYEEDPRNELQNQGPVIGSDIKKDENP